MNHFADNLLVGIVWGLLIAVIVALFIGLMCLLHFLLTLPMRRAERARLFLDLIDTAVKDGRPVEETLIAVSHSRARALGARFHAVAAWLEQGVGLGEALERVPRFVPPQIAAMLRAGQKLGDLSRVLPACRQLLTDAPVETRTVVPYVFMITMATLPIAFFIFCVKTGASDSSPARTMIERLLSVGVTYGLRVPFFMQPAHSAELLGAQTAVMAALLLGALLYLGGPRVARWLPFVDRLNYWKPWRRKRMLRDFSTMLGILLDSGVAEAEAIRLAADCTANRVFQRRAEVVIGRLSQGVSLPEGVQSMDDAGEFGWRLRNAFHGRTRFLRALTGWHEALDAKAFQQQQAAAHGITTAVVLWNGFFVAAIVTSVFYFLISITNEGLLW